MGSIIRPANVRSPKEFSVTAVECEMWEEICQRIELWRGVMAMGRAYGNTKAGDETTCKQELFSRREHIGFLYYCFGGLLRLKYL